MTAELVELTAEAECDDAVPVLRQLCDEKEDSDACSWREVDDYHLLGYYADGDLVGVGGVYVQVVLFHERTAWVHDLVVDEAHRSQGHGEGIPGAVREWAEEKECETVGLVSRLTNEDATASHDDTEMERFGYVYEREV